MVAMKFYEAAKFRVRPTFGNSTLPFSFNLDKWNKLNAKDKGGILAAGQRNELEMPWVGSEILAEEHRALLL